MTGNHRNETIQFELKTGKTKFLCNFIPIIIVCCRFSIHASVATFSSNSLNFSFMTLCKLSPVNSRVGDAGVAPKVVLSYFKMHKEKV